MPQRISNESDLIPFLTRAAAWRLLFAFEIGAVPVDQAAEQLGLDANEFEWLRTVALARVRTVGNSRAKVDTRD